MQALVARDLSLVTLAEGPNFDLSALFGTARHGHAHVPFKADTATERNLLGARLDAAVTQADRAVLLVAQGAACFAAAWWARLSPAGYVSRVAGAVMLAPFDEQAGDATLGERFASPRIALPFPSLVIEPAVPRLDRTTQVRALALGWGSQLVEEPSEQGSPLRRAIDRLTAAVVENKVRAAESFLSMRR